MWFINFKLLSLPVVNLHISVFPWSFVLGCPYKAGVAQIIMCIQLFPKRLLRPETRVTFLIISHYEFLNYESLELIHIQRCKYLFSTISESMVHLFIHLKSTTPKQYLFIEHFILLQRFLLYFLWKYSTGLLLIFNA